MGKYCSLVFIKLNDQMSYFHVQDLIVQEITVCILRFLKFTL